MLQAGLERMVTRRGGAVTRDTSTRACRNGSQLAWIGSATCAVKVSKVGPRCAPSMEIFVGVFCFDLALTRLVSMFRATFIHNLNLADLG